MRRSPSALLPSSNLLTSNVSTLILCILIFSSFSSAAAPDRIAGMIDSSQTIALAKSHHPKAQPQYDRGPVDPSFKLSYVTLLMAPSANQQKALDQLLAQQQDRQSPNYHKWLTPQQYADRFGLNQNDLGKVATWLKAEGFQIISVGGGRNTVIFSGTAAQAQRAFGTEIHNYEVDGEQHFANSTPVMMPAALNGIVKGVMGLHDFLPQPAHGRKRVGAMRNARPYYYDGHYIFPNFLAPGDITSIYDLGPLYAGGYDGTGQTLAIVGETDVYLDDLNDFRSGFGLTPINASNCTLNSGIITACSDPHFKYVLVGTDPGTTYPCNDLGEADLDLEWSGATAPNAQIVYINAPVVYDSNCNYVSGGGIYAALQAALDPSSGPVPALVVSMSYGECEFAAPDLESLLQQGTNEGITILNSSGDQASAACDYGPPSNSVNYPDPPYLGAQYGLAVSYPASSPEVTGVGGTAITLANDSYPSPSSYWNTPNPNPGDGGTAVCPGGSCVPEIPWNDDVEFVNYCQEPYTGDPFCLQGSSKGVSGWVALTTTATAAQVQQDIWINGGGGGASNCWYLDPISGLCLGVGGGSTGGGGFDQPPYQQGLSVKNAPTGVRYVPDVSLLASPDFPGHIWCTQLSELGDSGTGSSCAGGIFAAVDTDFSVVGGTSASAPIFAGMVTLLNQYLVAKGVQDKPGLGNINPTLYQLALSNSTNHAFHPVATGDNMVYCQAGFPTGGYPTGVVCPTAGVFGYQASDADSKTGYNLVTGLGSVDVNNLAIAWAATGAAATATTVTCSPNPADFGAAVMCTATVTSTGSTAPTGTVTLYNGATSLGSGTLSGGAEGVVLSTSALPSGSDSITAVYGGDTKNATSTSAAWTETINPPTFTWTNTGSTSATVKSGLSADYTFTATPTGGATTFAGDVNLTCPTGLPDATVACVFYVTGQTTPITKIAAGSGQTNITLTITTKGPNTATLNLRHLGEKRSPWLPLALPLAGIVMVGFAGRKISKYSAIAGLCVSLVFLGLLLACGGSSSPPPPVSVAVSLASGSSASVYPNNTGWPNQQAQFTATVTNTANTAVTWGLGSGSLTCSPTGGPCGSITSTGLYAAPTVASGLPTSVTITATSAADTTKSGSATEAITPATIPGTYPSITVTANEAGTLVSPTVSLTVN